MKSKQIHKFKETEIGNIPEDWKIKELQEISKVIDSQHITPKYSPVGIAMVRVTDIKSGMLDLTHTLKVSPKIYEEFTRNHKPQKNDIVMSRVGTYGVTSFVNTDEPFCLGQNTVVIHSPNNNRFIYYSLNSKFVKNQIEEEVVGSTQKTISLKNIREFLIAIPTNPKEIEQIANILYNLDSIIYSLQIQNKILEKIIQSIFKSWFIDFDGQTEFVDSELGSMPREWKLYNFKELAELRKGFSYKGSEKFRDQRGSFFVTLNSIKEGGGFKKSTAWLESTRLKERHYLKEYELIIANTEQTKDARLLVTPAIVYFPTSYNKEVAAYSHHITKVIPKSNNLKFYLYSLLLFKQYDIANAFHTGTGVWGFDQNSFQEHYKVILPPNELLQKFDKLSNLLHKQIILNEKNISILTELRDFLLPKLMSGEIRV